MNTVQGAKKKFWLDEFRPASFVSNERRLLTGRFDDRCVLCGTGIVSSESPKINITNLDEIVLPGTPESKECKVGKSCNCDSKVPKEYLIEAF
jgi:hypothetical protein